jgi:hypothetical protein
MTQINTSKVTDRRKLRFNAPEDLWRDIDRVVAGELSGKLRCTGNWTAGQTFGHLAAWTSFPYDGYPSTLRPPWFVKLILKGRKNKYLNDGLPAGVRIPKVEGGTVATEQLVLDEGLDRLRKAWDRLRTSPPAVPNPIFGPLSHQEWIQLNLRHAELHLSFLHPEGK